MTIYKIQKATKMCKKRLTNKKICNQKNRMMKMKINKMVRFWPREVKRGIKRNTQMWKSTITRKQEKTDVDRRHTTCTLRLQVKCFQTSPWVCNMVLQSWQASYGKTIHAYSQWTCLLIKRIWQMQHFWLRWLTLMPMITQSQKRRISWRNLINSKKRTNAHSSSSFHFIKDVVSERNLMEFWD